MSAPPPHHPRKHRRRKARAHAHAAKAGLPPGTPVYVGDAEGGQLLLKRMRYTDDKLVEHDDVDPEDAASVPPAVTWLDAAGLHDTDGVVTLARALTLHPLATEDLLNPASRPKSDDYGERVLVVVPMAAPGAADGALPVELETVGLVLGPSFVASFQERPGDVFDPLRRRIREDAGRVRHSGADYLLYALLDAVVDGWFAALSAVETALDRHEDEVIAARGRADPHALHALRAEVTSLRQSALGLREAISALVRTRSPLVGPDVEPYMRDLLDHTDVVVDLVDAARDRTASARDLQYALESRRMNDIMRVLTIFSSIFLPLSFVAGVYGMNFEHMPELATRYGYFAVLGFMATLSFSMLAWFRYKRWL